MESRAKLVGHPIHPMLIVFPLGLLATSFIFDLVFFGTKKDGLAHAAYWCIAAGVVGGLVAAAFGFWDWLAIPGGTRAKRIGMWHGGGNVVVVALFAASWVLRYPDGAHRPSLVAAGLSLVAVVIATVSGWLGGELVDRLGVGVDEGAHLDAPSSLSGLPAREAPAPGRLRRVA
jgi:uncharacterized membrane protein